MNNQKTNSLMRAIAMILVVVMTFVSMPNLGLDIGRVLAEEGAATPGEGENPPPVEAVPTEAAPAEKPAEKPVEAEPAEKPAEKPAEAEPAEKPAEKPAEAEPAEKPAEKPAEAEPAEKPAEKPAETEPAEKPAEKPAEAEPAEKPAEKPAEAEPAEKPAEKPAEQPEQPEEVAPAEQPVEQPAPAEQPEQPEEAAPAEQPVEQPAPAEQPEQPAPAEQPVEQPAPAEQPEQPAPAEQPAEQPEEPAPAEQPVEQPAPAEQPEEAAPAEQPVEQPEEPAPAEQPVEQPAPAEQPEEAAPAEQPVEQPEEAAPAEQPVEQPAPAEQPGEAAPVEQPVEQPAPAEDAAVNEAAQPTAPEANEAPAADSPAQDENNAGAADADQAGDNADAFQWGSSLGQVPDVEDHAEPVGPPITITFVGRNVDALGDEGEAENGAYEGEQALMASAPAIDAVDPARLPESSGSSPEGFVSALQTRIADAIRQAASLSGTLRVLLARNATYEGDVTVEAGEAAVADDFEIELGVEDAPEGEDARKDVGTTTIDGNLNIKGLKLLMNGVKLAMGKVITVSKDGDRGGELEYNGSDSAETVQVVVGEGSSATINTGAGADSVTVWAREGAVSTGINTGAANDTVNATVEGGTLGVNTGAGDDAVNLNIQGNAGNVSVYTDAAAADEAAAEDGARYVKDANGALVDLEAGSGDDSLNVIGNSAGSVDLRTGAGDDTVAVDARAATGDVAVDTGKGGDTVTATKGDAGTDSETVSDSPAGTLSIQNGGGTNRVSIDVSVSDALKSVVVSGNSKGDAVHLVGTLKPNENDPIQLLYSDGGTRSFSLMGEGGNKLAVVAGVADRFTDALKNKRTVTLTTTAKVFEYTANDMFTDYVLKSPVNRIREITINTPAEGLLLSNLVIDASNTLDDGGSLVINDLYAKGINLVLRAAKIDINGEVRASNVLAEASARSQSALDSLKFDGIGSFFSSLKDAFAQLFSVYDAVGISVGENASIVAGDDITLTTSVNHRGGMISVVPDINAVNVKVADAAVSVKGKLTAGSDGSFGSIQIDSKTITTIGYDDKGQKLKGMPLGVSVVVNSATVDVAEDAELKAAGNITLNSENRVRIATTAESGMAGAPFALAVNVLSSEVRTGVNGRLTAGGTATVRAVGDLSVDEIASRGSGQKMISGGYVAVNVIDQNVSAAVGKTGYVAADGDVKVTSAANVDATTQAVAGAPESKGGEGGETEESLMTAQAVRLAKNVWDGIETRLKLEERFSGLLDKIKKSRITKRLEKALKDVAENDYTVSVMKRAGNSQKGAATVATATEDNKLKATVTVTPNDGYTVKSVRYRYLEPGTNTYAYGETEKTENGQYVFTVPNANTEIVVLYDGGDGEEEQQQSGDGNDESDDSGLGDLFRDEDEGDDPSVNDVISDATSGAADDGDDDEDIYGLNDLFDPDKASKLTIEPDIENGAVVTYLEDPDHEGESLKALAPGQKVRFVPNPAKGYTLTENSMTIKYTVKEGGDTTQKTDVITPDEKGVYVFTVPENIECELGLNLTAKFEKKLTEEKDNTDDTNTQVSGSLAAAVVVNNNDAVIDEGSTVISGGDIIVSADEITNAVTMADGTAVAKDSGGGSQKKDKSEKPRPQVNVTEFKVTNAQYAVRLNPTQYGTVSVDDENLAHLSFTPTPDADCRVGKVLLSYFDKTSGKRVTKELEPEGGKYNIDMSAYAVREGSTVDISFVFAPVKAGAQVSEEVHPGRYLARNPISITYNALAKSKDADPYGVDPDPLGTVTCTAQTSGKYLVKAEAGMDGYKLESEKLTASYTDVSGATRKLKLVKGNDGWTFDPMDVPEGALISVNAMFTEDLRKVDKADGYDPKAAHGDFSVNKQSAKLTDKLVVTLSPEDDTYMGASVKLTWREAGTAALKEKTFDVDKDTGEVTIELKPEEFRIAEGEYWHLEASFARKNIEITATGSGEGIEDEKTSVRLNESLAYAGQTIRLQPSEALDAKGYKVTEAVYTYNDSEGKKHTETVKVTGGAFTFVVPDDVHLVPTGAISIEAKLGMKDIEVPAAELANGKLSAVSGCADAGDVVKLSVDPKPGYRLKKGTLKAEINYGEGSQQIVARRGADGAYSFNMPHFPEGVDPKNVKVKLVGEFEAGQADTSKVETSVGVSVAVGVVSGNNNARIRGGALDSAKDVSITATTGGKATTTAKAGFSAGNIGIGGAVAVQVASADTRAMLYKDDGAGVKLNGSLSLKASGTQTFGVTGDASGKAEAAKAGVGAGIAVAVNGADTVAAIQDGAILGGNQKGITASAIQKTADSVTGKAGAAGGISVVPVLALDIISSNAKAFIGKFDNRGAAIAGNVNIKASNTATHTVEADANATSGKTGLGGAFTVSVIRDTASAALAQSVNAKSVSLGANAVSKLTETATAGVTGGLKGKSDKKGNSGSTDNQVSGILKGGASLANKNKSSGMSGGQVQGMTANRQKAQTSEGSVAGAGAVAVNVMRNSGSARILDGANVTAEGALSVSSVNRTEANVKANASTTKSDIGVAVGVAVNVVTIENIARIGNGEIKAGSLSVTAEMPEAVVPSGIAIVKAVKDEGSFVTLMKATVSEKVNALFNEMGIDTAIAGELAATFTGTFVETLLKKPEFSDFKKLLDSGKISEIIKKGAETVAKSLADYPKTLMEPFTEAIRQACDTALLSEDEIRDIVTDTMNEATEQLLPMALESARGLMKKAVDCVVGNVLEMVNDRIEGKAWSGDKLEAAIKTAVKAELKSVQNKLVSDIVTRLSAELPLLTEDNISFAEEFIKTRGNDLLDGFIARTIETFRSEVFDYESTVVKFANTDLKKFLKDSLTEALKNASVALTNEALDKLLGKLDVSIEQPEDLSDKHVISTQAISGAGAKDVGVAGSVAVAVVNSNTEASVAASDKALVVNGLTSLNAEDTRRVTTVASSAVDGEGNADANAGAGKSKQEDTGDGSAAKTTVTYKNMTVTAGAGGSAKFDPAAGDSNPRILVNAGEGYKLPENKKAVYRYTDSHGEEKTGELSIAIDGAGQAYIRPYSASEVKNNDAVIEIEFAEDLRKLPKAETQGMIGPTDLSVSVEDREAKDGVWSAKAGDTVKVHVPKQDGVKLGTLQYTDASGDTHAITTEASSNGSEVVYMFTMPTGDITAIEAYFDWDDTPEDEKQPESESKNGSKQSVGVGASFAFVYGDTGVQASLGARDAASGTLKAVAASDHRESTSAVAGTDPLGGDGEAGDKAKDISLDAAVAVNALDTAVKSVIDASLILNDESGEAIGDGEDDLKAGDLRVIAAETGVTDNAASGFATGNNTAVGAAVAVNVAESTIRAEVNADALVAGAARVDAISHSEDNTSALATAMGADIQRNLDKVTKGAKATEETANKLLDGSYVDELNKNGDEDDELKQRNKDNKTASKINDRLNQKQRGEGGEAGNNISLSNNALRTQDASAEGASAGNEGGSEAQNQIKEATGTDVSATRDGKKSKYQVAAAVGVSVTDHAAQAVLGGSITANRGVSALAQNTGNFNTLGTGAAMSLAEKANSIAAGVAVSVNENKAVVDVKGDVRAVDGDVSLTSKLTQNMDGHYLGKLAAQSLAGSVAGKDSGLSIAGAISVVVSDAESVVNVAGGTENQARAIQGKSVTVEATDKSKLAARAGGVSISKGSSVGMGLASTTIVSSNKVEAGVGDNTGIKAGSFKLNAEKQAVTDSDFENVLNLRYVFTDSSALTDEQRENADTGLIDIHKGKDEKNYSVSVNLSSDKLLEAVSGLNMLSSQNTYAEAIAGSVMSGGGKGGKLSVAGSFAVTTMNNKVKAALGDNVKVTLSKGEQNDGSMAVNAKNDATARVIAGAISAAASNASVGATVAVMVDDNEVVAGTGDNAQINAEGDVTQSAADSGVIQVFTAAAAIAAGSKAKAAAGGAVNVIVTRNAAKSLLGKDAKIVAGGSASVTSEGRLDLMAISASANVTAGGKVAAGGTVNVIVDKAQSVTVLGDNNVILAGKDVKIASNVSDQLISGTASASAATSGTAVAGAVNVLVSQSRANTAIGQKANLSAKSGDLSVTADSDAWMLNAGLAASGASNAAIGGAFNVNVFNRDATVSMNDGTLNAGGNLLARANANDNTIIAGLSLAGSLSGVAVSGNVMALVENNNVSMDVAKGVTAKAGNNAVFEANYSDFNVDAGGSIALAGGSAAVGATVLTVVKNNKNNTGLARSMVQGDAASDAVETKTGEKVSGVYAGATAKETQILAAAGIAASGSASVTGVVNVLVNNNKVIADASTAALKSARNGGGSVNVKAADDTRQTVIAGGLNIGGSAGIGASVVTVISNKDVEALAHDMSAYRDVNVSADNRDKVIQLAVSAGGAGSVAVEVGAAVQVLKSKAIAKVASDVSSAAGSFNLSANNDARLINAAVAVGGSGAAAVTPVGVVTYFQGETDARLASGTKLTLAKGDANISATSNKDVDLYAVGAAASGTAGISGTANILVAKDTGKAVVESGTVLKLGGANLNITTQSDYKLRSASAAIGAAGVAGVAVNAIVSVVKGNAIAELGGNATTTGAVNVKASGARDVINVGATVGGAGTAGVGVTLMALVAGEKMSQDAADMLAYGNASDKKKKTTFDANAFLKAASASGADTSDLSDLDEQVSGNGHYESQQTVGGTTGKGDKRQGTFDAASGARSSDFDDKKFDDQGDRQRGEDAKISETKDVSNAKALNTYTYTSDPKDAVIARITDKATVKAKSVSVIASQPTTADLYGATAAVGGIAGVGVSTALALLRSNVSASSMGSVELTGGDMTVQAVSNAGAAPSDSDAKTRDSALKKALGDKLDPGKRAIRTVALTASGGMVGVGVSASVLLTDNVTQAIVGGTVKNAASMAVNAKHDYENVLAATAAVGGGLVGVNASVAVAQANATVTAGIEKGASVSTKSGKGSLKVTSDSNVGVNAIAATAGAGSVAVNGGVALAINRLTQNTVIREGAAVNHLGSGDLQVKGASATTANAYLLGVSAGGVGVTLSAAITNVAAKLNTGIGNEKGREATVSARNATVDVRNDVASASTPQVLSVAAGGVAVGGNVLLAFNDTVAEAKAANLDLTAKHLNVVSDLRGTATSKLDAATVGGVAVGVSVNYADMNADNRAIVRIAKGNKFNVTGDMAVRAGENDRDETSAVAETVAGGAGIVSVGVNTAVARNRAKNLASITGVETLAVGGTLAMRSSDKATAEAKVTGLNIGGVAVASSFGIALNEADTKTELKLPAIKTGKVDLSASQKGETSATMLSGGGALIGVTTNVATAYGRSKSTVDVELKQESSAKNGFSAKNEASDNVTTNIANQSFNYYSGTALAGMAFEQDQYTTSISLPMNSNRLDVGDGSFDIGTSYTSRAVSNITPAAAGVSASYMGVDVNVGTAKSTVQADTVVKGKALVTAKSASARTTGDSTVETRLNTPALSADAAKVNANVLVSLLKTRQTVEVAGDNSLNFNLSGGAMDVISTLNDNGNDHALAIMGGNGGGAKLAGIDIKANAAIANADASSVARVDKAQLINGASNMNVRSAGQSNAKASVGADNEVSVAGVGLNVLYSRANGTFDALLSGTEGLRAKDLNVTSEYSANARALGGVSSSGTGSASLVSLKVNVAEATVGTKANAKLSGSGIDQLSGALNVTAKGNKVAAESTIGTAKFDISGAKIAANVVKAVAGANQNAEIDGLTISDGGSGAINVDSSLSAETNATVGTSGGAKISLLNVQASTATADSNATATAKLSNLKMDRSGSNVTVNAALTKDKAYSDVVNGLDVALANVTVINTDSNARGAVQASMNAGNTDFRAKDVKVTASYNADADAVVKATGNTIGGFNGSFHTATTNTKVNAAAKLTNDQSYLAMNSLQVGVSGKVASDADAQTPTWTIGVGNVAANRSTAYANVSQTAAIENNRGGIRANGNVDVLSQVLKTGANASVGSSANSKSVGVLDGAVNKASACEQVSSTASVTGANALLSAGGAINVKSVANETTRANATSKAASSNGLMTAGKLEVNAYTGDSFTVKLEGMELHTESGDISIQAYANSSANGKGVSPGGYSAVDGSSSKVYSGVGTDDKNRQTVQILMGKNTLLTAGGSLDVKAENYGSAQSAMESKGSYSLGKVSSSSVPTRSWYTTKIEVGEGSVLNAKGAVNVLSRDKGSARSDVDADGMGLVMSLADMQGKNNMTLTNSIKMAPNTSLGSGSGNITVKGQSDAVMYARSRYMGGFGIIGGNDVEATNTLDRSVTVELGDSVNMVAENGGIMVQALTGSEDKIETYADVKGSGVLSRGQAFARTYITSDATVRIGQNGRLWANGDINVYGEAMLNSVTTKATAETKGLGVNPHSEAYAEIRSKAYVKLNENAGDMLFLTSDNGNITVRASGYTTNVYNYADARGEAAAGGSYALADINVDILHHVYLDKTQVMAKKSVLIHAINSEGGTSSLKAQAYAKMYAAGGYVRPIAQLRGSLVNEIRSRQTGGGYEDYLVGSSIRHYAQRGNEGISLDTSTDISRIYVPVPYISGWKKVKVFWKIYIWVPIWDTYDVSTTLDYSERNNRISLGNGRDDLGNGTFGKAYTTDQSKLKPDVNSLAKALAATIGTGTISDAMDGVWKARFDEEMNRLADELFVLELKKMLGQDVCLSMDDLSRYWMWNNTVNRLDTYMLPNATRLNTTANGAVRFVTEVLEGDILGDGQRHTIHMITALNQKAYDEKTVEVNRTTTLNFSTGILRVEQQDDFDLYQREVSGSWVVEKMQSGEFRPVANSTELLEAMNKGGKLPKEVLITGLVEDNMMMGMRLGSEYKLYWLGQSPQQTQDPQAPVYGMILNRNTDELIVFRSSAAEQKAGVEPKLVSVVLYRDAKADQRGEVYYNMLLRDSNSQEITMFEIVTGLLEDKEMELPSKLEVKLRAFKVGGIRNDVYCISGDAFVLNNGMDGTISVMGGAYTATFDGSVFESDYTRVEGCDTGDLVVTIKANQPIWPEWDTDQTAHDIEGGKFRLTNDGWEEVTADAADGSNAVAA